MAADDSGEPLSDQEVEALNLFESTAMREDLMLEFRHEPHNAFFINNYTTLHSRTEFEDWPELDRRRLLLRLWLKGEPSRAVHPILRRYYGDDGMHIDGRTDTIYDPEKAMTR
jgi:alpha-ketoglutarate-dependent taurine dioxygenase